MDPQLKRKLGLREYAELEHLMVGRAAHRLDRRRGAASVGGGYERLGPFFRGRVVGKTVALRSAAARALAECDAMLEVEAQNHREAAPGYGWSDSPHESRRSKLPH
jgi:hypothetical protein